MKVNVDKLVDGLMNYFYSDKMADLVIKIRTGGFKLSKIAVGMALALEAIVVVEKLVADMGEVGAGSEKKKAVKEFLDDVIELPFYLEAIDGYVIGIAIDAVVLYYNAKFGRGWIDKLKTWI